MKKDKSPKKDRKTCKKINDQDQDPPWPDNVSMTKEEFLRAIDEMTSEDIAKALDEMNPLIGKRYRDSLL